MPLGRPDEPEVKGHPLHPLAQIMELRSRFQSAKVSHDLKEGDAVREKEGIGILNGRPPVMLWRLLRFDNFADREIIRSAVPHRILPTVDCLVGRISDDAVCVLFIPHYTAFLEPYTPPEQGSEP